VLLLGDGFVLSVDEKSQRNSCYRTIVGWREGEWVAGLSPLFPNAES
jgi:hypothetical protein